MDPIEQALNRGWKLFRVHGPRSKCNAPGKQPVERGWKNSHGLTAAAAHAWLAKGGNVGLLCGEPSGRLIVVDIDGERPPGLPETPTVRTGGGGLHLYYFVPEGVDLPRANKVRVLGDVDIRYTDGFVVYVGSVHAETGAEYEWEPGLSPDDIGIASVPQLIVDAILNANEAPRIAQEPRLEPLCGSNIPYARAALRGACDDIANAQPGTRNRTIYEKSYKMGGYIASGNLDEAEVRAAIMAAAPVAPDFAIAEAYRAMRSGIEPGMQKPLAPPPYNPSTSADAGKLRVYIPVPGHNLSLKELWRRLPVSGDKRPTVALYHDAHSVGVLLREHSGTIGIPDARWKDHEWGPMVEAWAKSRKMDPNALETAAKLHWATTCYGHPSRLLAALWAFRRYPRLETMMYLRRAEWRMSATFCVRLQQTHGFGNPFPLSGEKLSEVMKEFSPVIGIKNPQIDPNTARSTLKTLVSDDMLIRVSTGYTGWSSTYQFTENYVQFLSSTEYITPPLWSLD